MNDFIKKLFDLGLVEAFHFYKVHSNEINISTLIKYQEIEND
jgi:hypothetical protein